MRAFFKISLWVGFALAFYSAVANPKTNPDISLNILLLGKTSLNKEKSHENKEGHTEEEKEHEENHEGKHGSSHSHSLDNGFTVQEVELYFKSNIDPYWTGNISLGIALDEDHIEMDLEEAFVESLFIPDFSLRLGKFYPLLGRHNNLHTHYYPFIDPPLINQKLFGFHGWNSTGASLAWLSPFPWYFEATAQSFFSFKKIWTNFLFLKNFWELDDSYSLEWLLSYGRQSAGSNHQSLDFHHLYNTALVYKWKPPSGSQSLTWTTEFMSALGKSSENNSGGFYSSIQWQFLKNGLAEGRAGFLVDSQWKSIETQRYSFLLGWIATEYSAIRLQYDLIKPDHKDSWEHSISIQSNMSLGTHPAHLY